MTKWKENCVLRKDLNSIGMLFFKVNNILLSVYPIKKEPIIKKNIKATTIFSNHQR